MSRSAMGLLNGHADLSPKDLPEPISLCNQMERCVVQLITRSTRKSDERSGMALCECSMPPALVIVAHVLCAPSVKKPAPPANRDG